MPVNQEPDLVADVTLENWQTGPHVQWSFQHVDEVVRTAPILTGDSPTPLLSAPAPLQDLPVTLNDGSNVSVKWVMDSTDTDGWIVWRGGKVLAEHYPRGMQPHTRHLLMSVSKSLTGAVAGVLIHQGLLDPARAVASYIPALATRGYGSATVRDLLDMRSGIRFSEEYTDPEAEVRVMEQVMGWATPTSSDLPGTLYDFLAGLQQKGPHHGPFEYRSCESDMLGWVCEAASGRRMTDLLSELLWSPMGAEYGAYIGVDSVGNGMYDGAICTTLRDLLRFGTLLLHGGRSTTGVQVLPEAFITDTWLGDSESAAAFANSPTVHLMPGGMYRNQCWFPAADRSVLLCLGIHGQMVYVNRVTGVVAAKMSSWADPQHAWKLFSTIRAFDTIGIHLTTPLHHQP
ncbi:MAG: beta-lactamase family protein [Actinomycetota bacterium]|nr:beta-lactamase family protein [Actinomycetota bacterium]